MADHRLTQELSQRLRQEMRLAPRMLQSIEVLQLPVEDLEGFLERAFQENEALAVEPRGAPGARAEASDRHAEWLANQPARDKGVAELLGEELALADLDGPLLAWVRFLLDRLDPNGWLSTPDEELLEQAAREGLEGDACTLGRSIACLQRLEPRGIGGRDAREALLLQLDPGSDDYGLLCRLIEEFLDDVARNKLPKVARALGLELERLDELLAALRELDPRPGASLLGGEAPAIRPDVVVERGEDGRFEVRVESSGLPSLAIDEDVRAIARDRAQDASVRGYLRAKIERARWLIEAVSQRSETLLRVARATFARQGAFLERGPVAVAPLRMGEVAEELGLHPSTVSRTVAGKHAQTPFGILPLRHFFQSPARAGAGSDGGDAGGSRAEARELVRRIVEGEDPLRPLSDDEIAGRLGERGLAVARRTVAKYRRELSIPSSYRRRRYG